MCGEAKQCANAWSLMFKLEFIAKQTQIMHHPVRSEKQCSYVCNQSKQNPYSNRAAHRHTKMLNSRVLTTKQDCHDVIRMQA